MSTLRPLNNFRPVEKAWEITDDDIVAFDRTEVDLSNAHDFVSCQMGPYELAYSIFVRFHEFLYPLVALACRPVGLCRDSDEIG